MERYNRQIILPELGESGQEKLKNAKVLIVGVGGLGSPIALYLTGAGVGNIGLIDDDVVSESNLQRQVLYSETEIGLPKAVQAQKRLNALNSQIKIDAYNTRLTKDNAEEIIGKYDIVVDGCDNFNTRYIINDTCVKLGKTYVYGAIRAFDGQVSVFNYQGGKNYRDLFPDESHPRPGRLRAGKRSYQDNLRFWRNSCRQTMVYRSENTANEYDFTVKIRNITKRLLTLHSDLVLDT